MVEKWKEGFDVVYAQKNRTAGIGPFKRTTSRLYYRLLGKLTEVDVTRDTGDFCLMDRKIVDLLNAMPERNRYIRGLRAWLGFRQTAILFDRPARFAGETKYPVRRMIALAIDGILSLSKAPLRLATYFGFLASGVSFLLAVVFVLERLAGPGTMARGWASTIVVVLFLGGVQLICLGVIGEFIGRIFDEVKQRPPVSRNRQLLRSLCAQDSGFTVRPIPVQLVNGDVSTVRLLRDSLTMFRDLVAIRRRAIQGGYSRPRSSRPSGSATTKTYDGERANGAA